MRTQADLIIITFVYSIKLICCVDVVFWQFKSFHLTDTRAVEWTWEQIKNKKTQFKAVTQLTYNQNKYKALVLQSAQWKCVDIACS